MTAPHPVADVLRLLADCDSTGALQVAGPPTGTFFLEQGRIVAVETDAVPPGATRAAVLDAATAILQRPARMPPRFTSGARSESAGEGRSEVAQLLADVGRALDRLARAGVGADDSVVVRPHPGRGVRIDAGTWRLVGRLAGPVSPRQIAWALGVPVLETVLAIGDLVEQGACQVFRVAVVPQEPVPPVPAPAPSSEPLPEPSFRPPPSPVALPVRRPGAALSGNSYRGDGLHKGDGPRLRDAPHADGQHRGQPAHGLPVTIALPEADLVLRLLDGLRRL